MLYECKCRDNCTCARTCTQHDWGCQKISSTHDFITTVKMEIRRVYMYMYRCLHAFSISCCQHPWCSIAVYRAFYVSLLHICCLRQCLVVVALENLAVQFMTSITSEYEKTSAKRDLMHVILCEIPVGPLQLHPFLCT